MANVKSLPRYYLNDLIQGLNNEIIPQIEPDLRSCQYLLMNYLDLKSVHAIKTSACPGFVKNVDMTKNLNSENNEEGEPAQNTLSTHEMNIVEDDPLDTTGQFFFSFTKIS